MLWKEIFESIASILKKNYAKLFRKKHKNWKIKINIASFKIWILKKIAKADAYANDQFSFKKIIIQIYLKKSPGHINKKQNCILNI